MTQKLNRFQVLTAAVLIRHPFPFTAAIVAVDHRRYRIHTQAINAKALRPVERVARQVVAHFPATKVVDQSIPVLVKAFTRVAVLIELGAVVPCQTKIVAGEVARHPVEQYVEARFMGGVNEGAELVTGTKTAGWRIHAQRLIAPAAIKRMFVDRQQFDMGKAHLFDVGHQLFSQLFVAQPEVVVGVTTPGSQMHFIDGDRRVKGVGRLALCFHLNRLRQTTDHRRSLRTHLRLKGVRVRFDAQFAIGVDDFILVELAVDRARYKQLPDAQFLTQTHRMTAAIPEVEIANH